MSAPARDVLATLAERGALLDGHFRLSSGRHSDRFIQKFRILEDPALLEPLARAIAEAFRTVRPTVVVSAAVGGIILGYEVARHLRTKAIFVEKENGVPTLRREFRARRRRSRADRRRRRHDGPFGARSRSTSCAATARRSPASASSCMRGEADFGVPTHALLDLPIDSYDPRECPQCAAGRAHRRSRDRAVRERRSSGRASSGADDTFVARSRAAELRDDSVVVVSPGAPKARRKRARPAAGNGRGAVARER